MRHIEFPADVLAQIDADRFGHSDPLVRRRMEVLWLKALDQPHDLIGKIASVSRATIQRLLRAYNNGGLEAVRKFDWKPHPSALAPYRSLLETEFTARPPHAVGEARERIAQLTGVRRGPTQVREFLRETMGFRWRKAAAVPVPPKQTLTEHIANQAAFLKDGA
jgi:transposase